MPAQNQMIEDFHDRVTNYYLVSGAVTNMYLAWKRRSIHDCTGNKIGYPTSYSAFLHQAVEDIEAQMDQILIRNPDTPPEGCQEYPRLCQKRTKIMPVMSRVQNDARWMRMKAQKEEEEHRNLANAALAKKMEEERRKIEAIKVQEWLQKKREEEKRAKELKKAEEESKFLCLKQEEELKRELCKLSGEIWLRHKLASQKAEKERKEKQKAQEEIAKVQKKTISDQKVNEWMQNAKNRPRPVSQGMSSRAKVAFVNPIPWKNILDEKLKYDD